MSIDLDKVVAIDIHAHAEVGRGDEDGLRPEWRGAAKKYFGEEAKPRRSRDAPLHRTRRSRAAAADFENAEFKDEVRPLILKENAIQLLELR